MEDKNLFQVVLDDDEQVLQAIRPHKGRAWFSTIVWLVVWSVIMIPCAIGLFVTHDPNSADNCDNLYIGIGALVLWVIITLILVIGTALWCHKTIYAMTNKRVLIRTGYIGVDYKSLDFNMVGALAVNVNVVDKLIHRNTGSIVFGSMASPMVSNNVSKFNFMFVHDPYRVYKEIKFQIDQKKVETQK